MISRDVVPLDIMPFGYSAQSEWQHAEKRNGGGGRQALLPLVVSPEEDWDDV